MKLVWVNDTEGSAKETNIPDGIRDKETQIVAILASDNTMMIGLASIFLVALTRTLISQNLSDCPAEISRSVVSNT